MLNYSECGTQCRVCVFFLFCVLRCITAATPESKDQSDKRTIIRQQWYCCCLGQGPCSLVCFNTGFSYIISEREQNWGGNDGERMTWKSSAPTMDVGRDLMINKAENHTINN